MSLITILIMGLFVSFTSVFIGLGGGILLVPLLPDYFGLSTHEAVATSLLTIFFVVSNNTYKFHQSKVIHWPVVFYMGPVSAIMAVVAAQVAQHVDARVILYALVGILILVAIKTLFSSFLPQAYKVAPDLDKKQKTFSIVGGAIAGLTSGFAGVGSGVILSPVMILLKTVQPKQLSPTANANMVFATLAASISYLLSGSYVKWNQWGLVRWDIALGVFISAAFFAYFLRPHQNKLPFRVKSLLLSVLLIYLIIKILIRLN